DIGEHFPDTDPQWKGVDSLVILDRVAAMVRSSGWTVGNIDCSVVCEEPKLAPHRDAMQRNLSDVAGAPVSVKGRRRAWCRTNRRGEAGQVRRSWCRSRGDSREGRRSGWHADRGSSGGARIVDRRSSTRARGVVGRRSGRQ
ncbi:MAG: 2-C-methyl-D-erythritol 2,4-cyclodiphosphate synthase, partial [Acidimicrobiia bacterium]|nr:2-C-methyl-D-erythritol 2,4-cyclodiphosphate synthase [Acidimicrobiia bacterium]